MFLAALEFSAWGLKNPFPHCGCLLYVKHPLPMCNAFSLAENLCQHLVGIDGLILRARFGPCWFWEQDDPFWISVAVSTKPELVNNNRSTEQYGGGRNSTKRKIHHIQIVVNFKFILK